MGVGVEKEREREFLFEKTMPIQDLYYLRYIENVRDKISIVFTHFLKNIILMYYLLKPWFRSKEVWIVRSSMHLESTNLSLVLVV